MIEIFSKKSGLLVRDIFFATKEVSCDIKRDIDIYSLCSSPIFGSTPSLMHTVDLSQDENVLFRRLSETHRRGVRRAVDTEGLIVDIDFAPTIETVESFKIFFNNFATFKGIPRANAAKLEALRSSGNFFIAYAHKNNEKSPFVMFSFISDGYNVYHYQGSTLPRVGNESILIGQASRLLHWQMMLTMKEMGMKIYNLGNLLCDPENEGLNKFKRQFGGVDSETYNVKHGVSRLGKLALGVSNLLNRR